jgi:hypothetical protein
MHKSHAWVLLLLFLMLLISLTTSYRVYFYDRLTLMKEVPLIKT